MLPIADDKDMNNTTGKKHYRNVLNDWDETYNKQPTNECSVKNYISYNVRLKILNYYKNFLNLLKKLKLKKMNIRALLFEEN